MVALQVFWSYVKKYWGILAIVLGAIIGFLFFRRQSSNTADMIKQLNDAHALELKQINDARAAEEAQHQANENQLNAALAAVQKEYDAAQKQLDDTKKAEVAQLVKDYGNQPDVLAQKLSDTTGFKIILPTQ